MKYLLIILSLILLTSNAYSQNTQITSFSKSKKLLLKVYKDNPVTLYCGCSFKGKKPDLSSCAYIPKKDRKRANRIEWEHLFLHMHSVNLSRSGGKVIPNVSARRERSLRGESVLKRLMKNIEECRQTCLIFILQSER